MFFLFLLYLTASTASQSLQCTMLLSRLFRKATRIGLYILVTKQNKRYIYFLKTTPFPSTEQKKTHSWSFRPQQTRGLLGDFPRKHVVIEIIFSGKSMPSRPTGLTTCFKSSNEPASSEF